MFDNPMNSFRDKSALFIIDHFPRLAEFARFLRGNRARTFSGWGMTTDSLNPPWIGEIPAESLAGASSSVPLGAWFRLAHDHLVAEVEAGRFTLSQFQNRRSQRRLLEELMWRHFIVYWTATYAASSCAGTELNLVECGVCDGLTAYFAMSAAQSINSDWHGYLYDAWEGMKAEQFLPSESNMAGNYSYLNIESTRRNLASLAPRLTLNRGFIPESFSVAKNPDSVTWLHIDLNSAKATLAALEFFADKLEPGAIVLFDDYGSVRYVDTKRLVDKFLSSLSGMLLPFPTGQGAFIKK
jgi:hypothetical protein